MVLFKIYFKKNNFNNCIKIGKMFRSSSDMFIKSNLETIALIIPHASGQKKKKKTGLRAADYIAEYDTLCHHVNKIL